MVFIQQIPGTQDEIKNKPEYKCEIGAEVYDSDDQSHIVEHK